MKRAIRRTFTLIKALRGQDVFACRDICIPCERLGSAYGGWTTITDRISADTIIYSFGIGDDASFDLALIERFGACVYAFDPTPKSIEWTKLNSLPSSFIMNPVGLADFDGQALFAPPEDPSHVSHTLLERPATQREAISVPVRRLSTIMHELGHTHVDILKMDIEGAEYAVIDDMYQTAIRPEQILVEFHHRFSGVGASKTRVAIRTLRKMGYQLFAISETNEEFSFCRIKSA
ncbi:MAG: FkbM family methyltransferase [Kiritimatiellae bacterium]|nr:FkbM family methyltransferase [Kiritimatiellia bacterium]MDD4018780.1 FkbM family methyltransferase [Kiritimatiellia bacterium]